MMKKTLAALVIAAATGTALVGAAVSAQAGDTPYTSTPASSADTSPCFDDDGSAG